MKTLVLAAALGLIAWPALADDIVDNLAGARQAVARRNYDERADNCAYGQTGRFLSEGVRTKSQVIALVVQACVFPEYAAAAGISEAQDRAMTEQRARAALYHALTDPTSRYRAAPGHN